MNLEKNEVRNDCAGEGQTQFNQPTDRSEWSQVVGQLPDNKNVNTEAEESTALGAIIKQQLVEAQQAEKNQ
jgi:hypothetical protein